MIFICFFPITRMELGGALGTVRDKIFVATGSEVRGFTKKGKMFLQFETNLAEKIGSMYISGSHLFVCGNYVFNHYNDCRDANYIPPRQRPHQRRALLADREDESDDASSSLRGSQSAGGQGQ